MANRVPPRFVVRTTIATLVMVAGVLTVVFAGFTINVRDRVRSAVSDKFDAGQRMLSSLEQRRARELASQVATLAENPTLKAAVDTYHAELGGTDTPFRREMLATIARELEKLAVRIEPDVLAVTDPSGTVLAVSGRRVGARILRSVPFLAPHLPIVELHHERPDGQGYPHRLRGEEIPLLARIVHVADAFDAMTSARAYRPARSAAEALRELWRSAGTQFDAEAVRALASALPAIEVAPPESLHSLTIATPQSKGRAGLAGLTAVSGGRA